jgi:diaminopimelate decarboxylase
MSPHPSLAAFPWVGGQLAIGGVPLRRLAERVGSTPFFAYDRGLLDQRVEVLRKALPPAVNLSYAMKANPMPAVVQHLASLVDALDVASAREMNIALDTPLRPEQISFAGPGKTAAEIRQAVAAGVTVELESRIEARRLVEAGESLGLRPQAAIRVNPDFKVKASGMRMGGGPQQFGVDAEQVPALLGELASADVDMLGFHIFAGSQNLQAEILCEAQRRTVELVLRLARHCRQPVRYVNLGGGFGIPYFEKDVPLDLAAVGGNLAALVDGPLTRELPEAQPVIELGRYIVGESGIYVTKIIDRKISRGQTYLVVDGGLHHQLAASGNFGQVIRRNYPLAVGTRIDDPAESTFTVVGCLCTPLDLLGDKVMLPDAQVDDLIVIFQAGAYGLTASPTAFLGHPAPAEVLI